MEVEIRQLHPNEPAPYDLLLLADPSKALVDEYLPRGTCYAVFYQNVIIGILVMIRTRPETMEIVNVAVREDYQGKGIGKKLIFYSIERAKELSIKTLEIGTGNPGVSQLMLYQKCGFRITGVDRDFFVRHYPEPIFENGIQCRDMIRMSMDI
jgi:N-acetylglutamate synthase-like GNAT family acetyltransferase